MACELELWQEAFRSVEDIQGLSAIGKKPPKPQLMALYYAKLTQIFTVSEAHLYNGCGDWFWAPLARSGRVACLGRSSLPIFWRCNSEQVEMGALI